MSKIKTIINDGIENLLDIGTLETFNVKLKISEFQIRVKAYHVNEASDDLNKNWKGDGAKLFAQIAEDRQESLELIQKLIEYMGNDAAKFENEYIENNREAIGKL